MPAEVKIYKCEVIDPGNSAARLTNKLVASVRTAAAAETAATAA